MKKFFGVLAVLAVTAMISSSVFAVKQEYPARVSFSSDLGTVTFEASLLKVSNNSAADVIGWDVDGSYIGVSSSTPNWKVANTYIKVSKTITSANGAIYLYQDNKNASGDADYVANNPRHNEGDVEVYNGLVKKGSNGSDGNFVAMSFRPSAKVLTTTEINNTNFQPEKAGVVPASQDNPEGKDYVVKYFIDKNDDNFSGTDSITYRTIANTEGYTSLENTKNVSDAYFYIAGNFVEIDAGTEYGSNFIRLNTEIE